ncbi:MAG: EamA family transporter [Methylibium sp.]|nr:EamA family transporter [Methylibium sp.]
MRRLRPEPGVAAVLLAALLFGAATPLAKPMLAQTSPWMLAALLYLGSGLGLWCWRRLSRAPAVQLAPGEGRWLLAAIVSGGVLGPALLMLGLSRMPASSASLLLNLEGVLTALLAWFVFKENFDRRIALGMLAIVAGGLLIAWPAQPGGPTAELSVLPALAVVGACAAWALDNNLTRKVALNDAGFIAMSKGLAAGSTNLLLALLAGADWPAPGTVTAAALLGFASYGLSLVLFVLGLRHLGTARTGAYFSLAPFIGALLSVLLLGEPMTATLALAAALMALGVALHLSERHVHAHRHEPLEHSHSHVHGAGDPHHEHAHAEPVPPGTRHCHWHRHAPLEHSHAHFPDAHHRHGH